MPANTEVHRAVDQSGEAVDLLVANEALHDLDRLLHDVGVAAAHVESAIVEQDR
ncbi:MAG: hypothetical protein JNK04_07325 [Myxococcales bacterium]|nr:hypothetical protein [Myxococcales bacterium]